MLRLLLGVGVGPANALILGRSVGNHAWRAGDLCSYPGAKANKTDQQENSCFHIYVLWLGSKALTLSSEAAAVVVPMTRVPAFGLYVAP